MSPTPRHRWVDAPRRADRTALVATLDLPPTLTGTVDAHRRRRGPYTAAGTLLDALVPEMLRDEPELVRSHDIEVLSAAPDFRGVVPASRETLTSIAVPEERTRFYSRMRTLRIANGLVELVTDHLARSGAPRTLVVDNAHEADHTDAEWLSVLLRRADPALLTVVVCTAGKPPARVLADALVEYCAPVAAAARSVTSEAATSVVVPDDRVEPLATRYVDTDGTSDDPQLVAAYRQLDPARRAALHDRRAEALESRDRFSDRLGAVPYHREHGSDPAGSGAVALRAALDYCINMGFYHANIDFGERGRAVSVGPERNGRWLAFSTKMTTALAALDRPRDAENLFEEVRTRTVNPDYHMQAAYATSMLYTRFFEEGERDHPRAKALINQAIAFASLLEDPVRRSMETVFNQNGLALIEVHLKNLPEALRLVTEGIDRLDRELAPDQFRLHRSVLRYNRAQVLAGLGRLAEALADYTAVIEVDPHYAEYYLDRGNILRRLGRDSEALADYEAAIRMSPPFPEVFYNRADLLLSSGDIGAGMAGLDYVLEIDPDFVDAYVNRAGMYVQLGRYEDAAADVALGLELDPGNAHLHCVRGQVLAQRGDTVAALAAYDTAIGYDPGLQSAYGCRAEVVFDPDAPDAAIADLGLALELGDDAALRFNRATALRAAGRRDEAVTDLRRARELDPDDPDIAGLLAELGAP